MESAVSGGHTEIVKLLLEKGADPNKPCALLSAASGGYTEIVKLLLEKGADPNKFSPMTTAAAGGYIKIVEMLLKKGADTGYMPPLEVTTWHSKMLKDLGGIFHDEMTLRFLCKHIEKAGLLEEEFHSYRMPNIGQLFIKLFQYDTIKFGEYTAIRDIFKRVDVAASNKIDHYTRLIKEEFDKRGQFYTSESSPSEAVGDKSRSEGAEKFWQQDTSTEGSG